MNTDPGRARGELTPAVIAMAHSLNLQVTGVGVETRQQWDFLGQHGCDAAQGNYFCAPAPSGTLTAMLLQPPPDEFRVANAQSFRPWRALDAGVDPGGDA